MQCGIQEPLPGSQRPFWTKWSRDLFIVSFHKLKSCLFFTKDYLFAGLWTPPQCHHFLLKHKSLIRPYWGMMVVNNPWIRAAISWGNSPRTYPLVDPAETGCGSGTELWQGTTALRSAGGGGCMGTQENNDRKHKKKHRNHRSHFNQNQIQHNPWARSRRTKLARWTTQSLAQLRKWFALWSLQSRKARKQTKVQCAVEARNGGCAKFAEGSEQDCEEGKWLHQCWQKTWCLWSWHDHKGMRDSLGKREHPLSVNIYLSIETLIILDVWT